MKIRAISERVSRKTALILCVLLAVFALAVAAVVLAAGDRKDVASADGAFIARESVVYDGQLYTVNPGNINKFLAEGSAKLTGAEAVKINSYKDSSGAIVAIPEKIGAAGAYDIFVNGSHAVDIVIQPADVDITDLDWQITKIGGTTVSHVEKALESGRLYTYINKNDGKTKVTYEKLDMTVEGNQNYLLYGDENVKASITRYRGTGPEHLIEIGLGVNYDASVYQEVRYSGVCSEKAYGKYEAIAILIPDNNHRLVTHKMADAERGIKFMRDGNNYVMTKQWYIVELENWLVANEETGESYDFDGNTEFGTAPNFTVPRLSTNDCEVEEYGTANDLVTMTLYRNDTVVDAEDCINRANYARYINKAMPAGDYRLDISVHSGGGAVEFTRSFNFTVEAMQLPSVELDALNTLLRGTKGVGNTFPFEWDGKMHLLNAAATNAINALKDAVSALEPDRTDTVWAGSSNDLYYGGFDITFNLDRMHNSVYYTETELATLAERPVSPNKYTVYYMITAKNFASLVNETFSPELYDSTRREYLFNVLITRMVTVPELDDVVYNGSAQKADVPNSELYTVDDYAGFTDVGTHTLTLRLINPDYYYWKDKSLGVATETASFKITRANNIWIESPDIVRWVEGKYNADENKFIGSALFGDISYVITDVNGENVYYDASKNINELAKLKAGTYFLRATVAGTDNYTALSDGVNIRILEKEGLPGWAVALIVVGSFLIVAAVIFIMWKKGVFSILTNKLILSIRTKATVDATIAAVRAAKVKEQSEKSLAAAAERDRLEAEAKAQAEKEAAEKEAAEKAAAEKEVAEMEAAKKAEEDAAASDNAAETKPAAKKPAAKKSTAKKPADGEAKPAAKKSTAKKPADGEKKPAAKKTAAKKTAEKAPEKSE